MILKALGSLALLAVPAALFGQANDGPFQVSYVTSVTNAGVNVTNDGFTAGGNIPSASNSFGDICVNVYLYAPKQSLATCCTCLVPPNTLVSFSVASGITNLFNNATTANKLAIINGGAVIKLLGTQPTGAGAGTTDSCPRPDAPNAIIPAGLLAWRTQSDSGSSVSTEVKFEPGNLSAGEFGKLNTDCAAFFTQNPSAPALCPAVCKR